MTTTTLYFVLTLLVVVGTTFAHQVAHHDLHPEEDGDLLLSVVITRHGDRTPVSVYENTESEWPEGSGQLTGLGMKQQSDLGVKFRQRYIEQYGLIDAHWRIDQVYARSTSRCRTLQSAHSFFMGFFPPGTGPNLPLGEGGGPALPINIQPVPVHSYSRYNDSLLYAYKNCPKLKKLIKQTRESDEWRRIEKENAPLLDQLSAIFGEQIKLKHMTSIKTLINAERIHGKPQLPGVTKQMMSKIKTLGAWVIKQKFATHEMGRLGAGFLPAEIRNRMKNMIIDHYELDYHDKSQTEISPKDVLTPKSIQRKQRYKEAPFVLFSAHDGTLLALLSALRAHDYKVPYFSSHLVFELYAGKSERDEPTVKIFYDDEPLSIHGCGHTCSYNQFSRVIDESYEPDWEQVCEIEWLKPKPCELNNSTPIDDEKPNVTLQIAGKALEEKHQTPNEMAVVNHQEPPKMEWLSDDQTFTLQEMIMFGSALSIGFVIGAVTTKLIK